MTILLIIFIFVPTIYVTTTGVSYLTNFDKATLRTMIASLQDSVNAIPFANDNTDYQTFKKDLANGAELQDSEGNVIDGLAYLATLDKEQQ
jgi:hypothetical protein